MDSASQIRQMPISADAERAVLGALIIKPESFDLIGGMLDKDDFYFKEHQHIFSAITSMYTKSQVIDTVTLINAIVEFGERDEAGGVQYIKNLAESVPSTANIKDYARIVKDKAVLRKLIDVCEDISDTAYDEAEPVRTIIDSAEQAIFNISHNSGTKDFRHIRDVLHNVYKEIETLAETGGAVTGSKTGFSALDKMLIQMGKGDLIIVGARPGMGKTSFALNIATNVAKTKKAVAIFSLEMPGEQLVHRLLSSEALIDSSKLRTGQLQENDWDNLAEVAASLSSCDIYIDDTSSITATEMKSKLRRIPNLGLVVIDYIGLMQSTSNSDNRAQQVGEISRNLKIMAKDFGIPIVCCAQLNRGTESRTGEGGKKPTLADLRDSGSIEQDADIVLFLYRDEYYNDIKGTQNQDPNAPNTANTAEVIVAKNRHGSVGNAKMGWIGQFTKFRTLEEDLGN